MRGRTADPNSPYKMLVHTANGYTYAATVVTAKNAEGKNYRKYQHYGTIDQNFVFKPFAEFLFLPGEEKAKFIFPEEWDLSYLSNYQKQASSGEPVTGREKSSDGHADKTKAAESGPASANEVVPPVSDQYNNRLYGHVWFMLKIAEKLHVYDDLMITFDHEEEIVNDILTLAVYPCLGNMNYSHVSEWQQCTKTMSLEALTPPRITNFTKRIQERHRMSFIKLRVEKQPKEAVLACDSTTRSAWGSHIAEIRWGNNKDNADLANTVEVVVYSVSSHQPIYYRSFAGNISDLSTVTTILYDLRQLDIDDVTVIFDRGYESPDNMERFFRADLSFLMCSKTNQKPVIQKLLDVEYDNDGFPKDFEVTKTDKGENLFYKQFSVSDYTYLDENGQSQKAKDFCCNVYMNPADRADSLLRIRNMISGETEIVKGLESENHSVSQLKQAAKNMRFHKLKVEKEYLRDASGKALKDEHGVKQFREMASFVQDEDAIRKVRARAGYFSSLAFKFKGDALAHLKAYRLRDEQEKYFYSMKDFCHFDTVKNSNELARVGGLFIMFVGLILVSHIKSVWSRSEILKKKYHSTLSLYNAMMPIRYVDGTDRTYHITSFTSEQVEICREFGIEPPPECLNATDRKARERAQNPKKRGRPAGSGKALNKSAIAS